MPMKCIFALRTRMFLNPTAKTALSAPSMDRIKALFRVQQAFKIFKFVNLRQLFNDGTQCRPLLGQRPSGEEPRRGPQVHRAIRKYPLLL
jgi:hypothetical protein